jgi:hypothetical protein
MPTKSSVEPMIASGPAIFSARERPSGFAAMSMAAEMICASP